MSGRGHRAALPAGGHAQPEYLVTDAQGGRVVRHHDREGRVREYDFAQLPVPAPMRASLAALFAARCTPDRWSAHWSSEQPWLQLRRFAQFLASQEPPPRDLEELTPAMVRRWRAWLPAGAGGYYAFGLVSGLLLGDERLQAGPVADELARRGRKPRSKLQSYSEAELEQVTAAARRRFRAALQRINDDAVRLRQWRDGILAEGSAEWAAGEGLDILARTGDLPRNARKDGQPGNVVARYRNALGTVTWQRLFLTREEAVALGVLLLAEFGWNLSVISGLEVPMASPDQGEDGHPTYRIPLVKPRRGPGRHHETRNVTDHGAGSPGRLITQALQATRFARAIVAELAPGTARLMVWRAGSAGGQRPDQYAHHGAGPFRFGVTAKAAKDWADAEGLEGSPFRRGRRTVIALDRREPGQHSQDTHDRHYVLPDERIRAEAVEVIAAGAEDAADRARKAVLAAELRDQPDPGDAETATAACSGTRGSPQRHPDLKDEFYRRIRERGADNEDEARLRGTIARLKKTITAKNKELAQLRTDVPALIRAVNQLTLENQQLRDAHAAGGTVVPFPGRAPARTRNLPPGMRPRNARPPGRRRRRRAELLQFLGDWLESDRANLTASLARFVGCPDYGPDTLRSDFARFRFLLGVADGEGVFTPDQP